MSCDDLPYFLMYLVLGWVCIVAWAIISVWEWYQARRQYREYQGLLNSLLTHLERNNVRAR